MLYSFKSQDLKSVGQNIRILLPYKHRKTTISQIWREKERKKERERERERARERKREREREKEKRELKK